ncbi:MAG: methionyl-tRNA formyltransferase [Treponema sp.]|jgi:methionyl-tRNA formyltransferase|nr:methionyl-tRNA formyltransferase [Treponema sp.]
MRVLFAGSPGIAVPCLEALALTGAVEIAGVLTNPDAKRGRRGEREATEVGAAAEKLSARLQEQGRPPIPVLKPIKLDGEAREAAAALQPDLLVSFAYGHIFGPKFLGLFPRGGINIHPSLLPKYRGPAPIPAAIINRDGETGITIQVLAAEMDSGDILAQSSFPLTGRETTGSLSEIAARKAAEMLPEVLKNIAADGGGPLKGRPQNHGAASFCSLLSKEDGRIDWKKSALEIDARIRAFDPWPLSYTMQGDRLLYVNEAAPAPCTSVLGAPIEAKTAPGAVLGIDKGQGILIQTGDGVLAVRRLQYQTKKELEWRVFLNGARDFIGSMLE